LYGHKAIGADSGKPSQIAVVVEITALSTPSRKPLSSRNHCHPEQREGSAVALAFLSVIPARESAFGQQHFFSIPPNWVPHPSLLWEGWETTKASRFLGSK
jgi:hypothetical protein